jgi:hypothetical protein
MIDIIGYWCGILLLFGLLGYIAIQDLFTREVDMLLACVAALIGVAFNPLSSFIGLLFGVILWKLKGVAFGDILVISASFSLFTITYWPIYILFLSLCMVISAFYYKDNKIWVNNDDVLKEDIVIDTYKGKSLINWGAPFCFSLFVAGICKILFVLPIVIFL